jgi:5-methyltetrahydropteroyltriglutamate--homocysteine methyltransferase
MTTKPPFRADQVGSLLRTAPLKDARAKFAAGSISAANLKEVEDIEIIKLIKAQENIGLKAPTDGEFRRSWWHYDFLWNLDGVSKVEVEGGIQFAGVQTKAESPRVTGKIGFTDHPFIDHFKFVKEHTKHTAKMTIPSPSMLHYRGGKKLINMGLYPNMDDYFTDLSNAYKGAVNAFGKAGCSYLQLDDVSFAYFCDPEQRKMLADRGDNPDTLPAVYASMIENAIKDRPKDMTITMHLCRGNFRSTFVASGGYEPIADLLFNTMSVDGYFMEWDNDRSGGFEPLRFLPKGKHAVLGLVTSKSGTLETREDLLRRIEEASKYADISQLCLSAQCGFASTEEGNSLAEAEQWKKLELIVKVSEEVWG